jgi:hypothetical protein
MLKKAHGIGLHGIGIGAARDQGIVGMTEESVLNPLSALLIRTTIAQLFQTSEVAIY